MVYIMANCFWLLKNVFQAEGAKFRGGNTRSETGNDRVFPC